MYRMLIDGRHWILVMPVLHKAPVALIIELLAVVTGSTLIGYFSSQTCLQGALTPSTSCFWQEKVFEKS